MVIAYLRVSTEKQQLDNQRFEILNFAASKKLKIDKWRMEIVSGTKNENVRILGEVLKELKSKDILIVSELSRLSRAFWDIIGILNLCIKKDICLYSVKEGYELSNNLNSKIMSFVFSLVSELERNLISIRTKEALSNLKANGVVLGRPSGSKIKMQILYANQEEIEKLRKSGIPCKSIATRYKVSKTTLFSFFREIKG